MRKVIPTPMPNSSPQLIVRLTVCRTPIPYSRTTMYDARNDNVDTNVHVTVASLHALNSPSHPAHGNMQTLPLSHLIPLTVTHPTKRAHALTTPQFHACSEAETKPNVVTHAFASPCSSRLAQPTLAASEPK
ncbi:hypothetical protein M758_8G017500 [Ceratodon purpureus]|uniref:Uncharacterized protein n=1 Tax=Ceratodon purpureus TaxID=3225 RepID=A0A8T0GYR7_CERPU|nr:hypothetical protein KC19_8G018000 [Ceratodon purpureus]KAG0607297.1 hypothetical protein M758_8G017500 [Ceratodon purpureus]